ncbi:MAG: queuosine precursor transporter [Bacteroidia bacterium]|nr:queuosine precursor transporter [Bacteroidia bacterium]MBP9689859.1 queuosine precursor transporter [Bacteroidia bacterium]
MKEHKRNILFLILGSFFIANAIIAEFVGVKIFSVEQTLGITPFKLNLLGDEYSFNMTAGVLLWPMVFVMTDIINEYFGKKGVKLFSYIAAALIAYSFVAVYATIHTTPADFWITKETPQGSLNMQLAFSSIFGQGLWIIAGSLIAFLVGQVVDVYTFHFIKNKTGNKALWLRSTGSTLVSQFIDSFVVLIIAFYIGGNWPLKLVLAVGVVNYIYKFIVAIVLTPLLYVVHAIIDNYLGKDLAEQMMAEAAKE